MTKHCYSYWYGLSGHVHLCCDQCTHPILSYTRFPITTFHLPPSTPSFSNGLMGEDTNWKWSFCWCIPLNAHYKYTRMLCDLQKNNRGHQPPDPPLCTPLCNTLAALSSTAKTTFAAKRFLSVLFLAPLRKIDTLVYCWTWFFYSSTGSLNVKLMYRRRNTCTGILSLPFPEVAWQRLIIPAKTKISVVYTVLKLHKAFAVHAPCSIETL